MTYTLPRNQRIVITEGVAKLAHMHRNWGGGDVDLVFSEQFGIDGDGERWWEFDLITGAARPLTLIVDRAARDAQRNSDRLAAEDMRLTAEQRFQAAESAKFPPLQRYITDIGMAFVRWRRKATFVRDRSPAQWSRSPDQPVTAASDDVTIYIDRWFHISDPANDDLDIARDAWFAHDIMHAEEIVKRVIPHSSELFLACIKLEFEMLQKQSVVFDGRAVIHDGRATG